MNWILSHLQLVIQTVLKCTVAYRLRDSDIYCKVAGGYKPRLIDEIGGKQLSINKCTSIEQIIYELKEEDFKRSYFKWSIFR